jgi:hypothetical protein
MCALIRDHRRVHGPWPGLKRTDPLSDPRYNPEAIRTAPSVPFNPVSKTWLVLLRPAMLLNSIEIAFSPGWAAGARHRPDTLSSAMTDAPALPQKTVIP